MPNIELRGNIYCAVLIVPKDVREVLGRHKFRKSLETGDKRRAERLAAYYITQWKDQIEKARGNQGGLAQDILLWQGYFETNHQAIAEAPKHAKESLEAGMDFLDDTFIEHLYTLPEKQAIALHGVVNGAATLTTEYFSRWKTQLDLAPKTIDQMIRDVQILLDNFITLEEITKEEVLKLIGRIEDQGKGVTTIKRLLFAFNNYWHYLQDSRLVSIEYNPFDIQHLLQGKFKRANRKKITIKAFKPSEVVAMWSLARTNKDYQLADLIAIGAYTGARIEELCSLKIVDINDECFSIRDAKTTAGDREIPIHSMLASLVERLKQQSKDGYLISGLSFNKYDDRSNAIGKRFGRLKTKAGFDRSMVFHSLRHSLITQLENAGVSTGIIADIVGHEKKDFTTKVYSDGHYLSIKSEALEKVSYPFTEVSI